MTSRSSLPPPFPGPTGAPANLRPASAANPVTTQRSLPAPSIAASGSDQAGAYTRPVTGRPAAPKSHEPQKIKDPAGGKKRGVAGRLRRVAPSLPRPVRLVLQGTLALAFLGMFGLAVLYVLVQSGPISIGFLVRPLEESINRELGTGKVEIESAVLRQSEDGRGIEFRLTNLRILDTRGAVLAETPFAGISLSGAAILRGRLAPVSVEFIRPKLSLTATPEGGLALAVSRPEDARSGAATPSDARQRSPAPAVDRDRGAPGETPKPIDLAGALQHAMADFRQGEAASSYLRELGLRDATLTIEHGGHQAVWHVPGFTVDVQRFQKRSTVVGEGLIGSDAGPFGLSFRTTESGKAKRLRFETEIAELNPRAIASNLSFLPGLSVLDMAVAGTAKFEVSLGEGLAAADVKLTLSPGRLVLPAGLGGTVQVRGGALHLSYVPAERRVVLHPSELIWNDSRAIWSGAITPGTGDAEPWGFELSSRDVNLEGTALESVEISGHTIPRSGRTRIDKLLVRAQGAQMAMSGGSIATSGGPQAFQLDGNIGPVTLPALLKLWPKTVAPQMAQWFAANISKGRLAGGTIRLGAPAPSAGAARAVSPQPAAVQPGMDSSVGGVLAGLAIDLELQDIQVNPVQGFVPVQIDQARLRLDSGRLDVSTSQARLPLPSGRQIVLKDPRLLVTQPLSAAPQAEATLQSTAPASALLELLDQEPLGLLRSLGLEAGAVEGKGEAFIKANFPAAADLKPADVKLEGRIKLTEARSKSLLGGLEISGGSLLLGLTDKSLDAKGDVLIGGVPAKVSWQRILGAPADRQPPARVTATLDATDRDALGLDVNHIVQGDVPVVVTLQQDIQGHPLVHLEANLGAADLIIDTMAWRKPAGRPAVLHSDVTRAKDGHVELTNFKIVGDDIALDGSVTLDAKNDIRAFNFPGFAVNVLTKLEMSGRVRDDGVLEVKAKGTAYDGRPFFKSMFSWGQITDRPMPQPRRRLGLDLTVDIDTILGFTDTNLKGVHFVLNRRGDKIAGLQASGMLSDSGVAVNAEIRAQNGARILHATSNDAGSALRLIGFYPNMRGGTAVLDVNLDGKGHAERTGRLGASQFVILGDPVVNEVLQGQDEVRKGPRKVVREQIEFDHLDVPFSVGYGQVVLGDSTINGPLLGARLNGKIDYNKQTVFLEGTYVPLYGLNSIPNSIPIIGEILSGGRAGDGLFGITFLVQGPMGRPQVLVNPLSMLTPGLLRQIWETAPQGQSVIPRGPPEAKGPPALSSSAPAQTGDQKPGAGKASSSGPQRVDPAAKPAAPQRPPPRERASAPPREDGQ